MSDMPKYPDPEQYAGQMDRMRGEIERLQSALDIIRTGVKVMSHDVSSLQRERDEVLQALSNAYRMRVRMHPKEGLQGWCVNCEAWHPWSEWV